MREEAECKQAAVRHGPFAVPLIMGLNFPMDMNMFKTVVAFLHFPTLPYLMGFVTKFIRTDTSPCRGFLSYCEMLILWKGPGFKH